MIEQILNHGEIDARVERPVSERFAQGMRANRIGQPRQPGGIAQYFSLYLHIPPDMEQFATLGDYYAYGRTMSFDTLKGQMASHDTMEQSVETWKQQRQTLQGEQVKSLEEAMIANFLFLHGVDYVYEQPYEHDTRDAEHRQYVPDFIYRSIICILNTLASPGQAPCPG